MQALDTLALSIGQTLKRNGATIMVAESSTGGLVSAALLAVPGASAYFRAGGVVYTADARRTFLGIDEADLAGGIRSSSEPYARLLAERGRTLFGTTWAVAETGAAGPTGNRYGDAAGHTCLAVAGPRSAVSTLETASSDRVANMWAFAEAALGLLERCLAEAG
jgi:nicotinamide-nucleotide amidase